MPWEGVLKLTNWFLNFDFNGRGRRSHSWANWASWLVIWFVTFAVIAAVGPVVSPDTASTVTTAVTDAGDATTTPITTSGGAGAFGGILLIIVSIASFIDSMAMTFRRAHDTNKSGWIFLMLVVPFVNLLALYWLLIEDSQEGPNKYGPPVKQFYEPGSATA